MGRARGPVRSIHISVFGQEKLERALKKLPNKVALKVQRKGINRAAQIFLKEAKRTAPVDEGDYKRALRKKIKSYRKTATVWGAVGTRYKQAPHDWFIQAGTKERRRFPKGTSKALKSVARGKTLAGAIARTQQTGASTGRMPAIDHMDKVLRAKKRQAMDEFFKKLGKEIEKEAAKLRNG